jgi:hypothetical protein
VPDGRVPFIIIPDGGTPDCPADWLTCGPSLPDIDWSGVSDDEAPADFSVLTVEDDCGCTPAPGLLVDCVVELPESVHPAQKIPATRTAETISMNILLFFMGYLFFSELSWQGIVMVPCMPLIFRLLCN